MPVADIASADVIVIVGSNLRHEVPLLHQRVRQAWRKGAKVHVVNPVDFEFTFDIAGKQIVAPSRIADALGSGELAGVLRNGDRAAVIVGALAESGPHAAAIRAAAIELAGSTGAALCRIPQGANALGLANAGVLPASRDARAMLAEPRAAYVLYGIEPGLDFADQAPAMQALRDAQVVAFSHFACESTRAVADVILPIGLLPEVDATLTNLDGREQQAVAGAKLPGEARAGWRVLRALGAGLELPGFEFTDLAGLRAGMGQAVGARRPATQGDATAASTSVGGLELAMSPAIYRSDAVVRRAAALQAHPLTLGPRITLNPDDARRIGVAEYAMAKVSNHAGIATVPVSLSDNVAAGAAWVEGGYGETAALAAGRVEVQPA